MTYPIIHNRLVDCDHYPKHLTYSELAVILDAVEKEHPSILRLLAEETIQRLYEYMHSKHPISWLCGIEADLISALNYWGGGCLNTAEKRSLLKARIKTIVIAARQDEIKPLDPASLERIYELSTTINVINETLNYLNEIKGEEILHALIQQTYDLKRIIEWKRRLLQGLPVKLKSSALTEAERNATTPLQIKHILQKRILNLNARLLSKQGRDDIIAHYSVLCEQEGFNRYLILHHALAETAEMLNAIFDLFAQLGKTGHADALVLS